MACMYTLCCHSTTQHSLSTLRAVDAPFQEFKEDLGATGDKKTAEDKKDIQQRQDDKLGLKMDETDAQRSADNKT